MLNRSRDKLKASTVVEGGGEECLQCVLGPMLRDGVQTQNMGGKQYTTSEVEVSPCAGPLMRSWDKKGGCGLAKLSLLMTLPSFETSSWQSTTTLHDMFFPSFFSQAAGVRVWACGYNVVVF